MHKSALGFPSILDLTIEELASNMKETKFFFFSNEKELTATLRHHAVLATRAGTNMHGFAQAAYMNNNVTYDFVPFVEHPNYIDGDHVAYLMEIRCKVPLRMKVQRLGMVGLWVKEKGNATVIDMKRGFTRYDVNPKQTPTRQCPTVIGIDERTPLKHYREMIASISPNSFTDDDNKIDEHIYVGIQEAVRKHLRNNLNLHDRFAWENLKNYLYVTTSTVHTNTGEKSFDYPLLFSVGPGMDNTYRIDVFLDNVKRLASFSFGLAVDVTGALHFKQITSVEDVPYQAFPVQQQAV